MLLGMLTGTDMGAPPCGFIGGLGSGSTDVTSSTSKEMAYKASRDAC
jgi:hypothetical protein